LTLRAVTAFGPDPVPTEDGVLERAAVGDRRAFDVLAATHSARMYNVARMILRDDEMAADALQEALVRAWRDLPQLREPDRLAAWLNRLVVNACYDEIRRKRRWRLDVGGIQHERPTENDESADVADRDQLARGLSRLPVDQRVVLVLRYYLDLPVAEIADILGIPVGTVKSRVNHGISALRAVLDADLRRPSEARRGSA
jgi:RNA polymerase sigma-70 factor (ECF subfamily)